MGIPIVICYGGAEEAAKHKHSPKREKTGVITSGSSSTQIEETNNVILGEETSEQEEKIAENQGRICLRMILFMFCTFVFQYEFTYGNCTEEILLIVFYCYIHYAWGENAFINMIDTTMSDQSIVDQGF